MDMFALPQDDLLDVMEMTQKLERYILKTLGENDLPLAMSALMSAVVNSTLSQCTTLDEVIFYRTVFMQVFDSSIRSLEIK